MVTRDSQKKVQNKGIEKKNQILLRYLVQQLLQHILKYEPSALFYDINLTTNELKVYRQIVNTAGYLREVDGQYLSASHLTNSEFVKATGLSERSVISMVQSLQKKGYIIIQFRQLDPSKSGVQRSLVLRNWSNNEQYVALCFAQYPDYVKLELLKNVYSSFYMTSYEELKANEKDLIEIIREFSDMGIQKWIQHVFNLVHNDNHMKIQPQETLSMQAA